MATMVDSTSGWPAQAFPAIPANAKPDGYIADPAATDDSATTAEFKPFGDDGLTFGDFVDMINPLQHIPLVGHIYREMTGDMIDPMSRIAGSTLFFGPIGTATAALNVYVEHETGKDIGDHAMAMFDPGQAQPALASSPPVELASTTTDAVTAWARGEIAWASQQAALRVTAPAVDTATAASNAVPGRGLLDVDANQFLMQAEKRHREQTVSNDIAEATPAEETIVTALWSVPKQPATLGAAKAQAGAAAPLGGWFAEAMLDARAKYLTAERLGAAAPTTQVNIIN